MRRSVLGNVDWWEGGGKSSSKHTDAVHCKMMPSPHMF